MSKAKGKRPSAAATDQEPAFLVFGLDDKKKPRGARFTAAQRALAIKAAEAMGLHHGDATEALAEVIKKLPPGRLYANGKGFMPPLRRDLYSKLAAAFNVPDAQNTASSDPIPAAGLPRTFAEIDVGKMVLAQSSLADGWWETVVLERNGEMLTLKYRDYPKEPKLVRNIAAVALINPGPEPT